VSHSALQSASHIINEANMISSLKSTAPLYEEVQEELEDSKSYSIPYVDPNYPGEPCKRILFGLDLDEQAKMGFDMEGGIPAILHYLMEDIATRGVDEPNVYVRKFGSLFWRKLSRSLSERKCHPISYKMSLSYFPLYFLLIGP
jgi:hypothetical protein